MNKILYKLKDGKPSFWLMRDYPVIPILNIIKSDADEDDTFNSYHQYLNDCGQSKANALEIINPDVLPFNDNTKRGILHTIHYFDIKPNSIIDFPEGLEFKEEIIQEKRFSQADFDFGRVPIGSVISTGKKVIRLIPKQKEESQEELFSELFDYKDNGPELYWNEFMEKVKSKFTIQRKKS